MIKIALITLLGIGGLAGLSPYAPRAAALEPGGIYRTGSPLSQPGVVGLLGGLVGTHRGGGYEMYVGPYISPAETVYDKQGGFVPATAEQYRAQTQRGLTPEQAQQAVGPETAVNRQRVTIPDCDGQLFITWVSDAELGARAVYSCGGK